MNKHGKFSSILAAIMVMSLALPGGAWAGGRYDKGGHDYGYQQKGQSGGHYNKGGHDYGHQQKGQSGGHYNNHNKYSYNNYYNNNYYGGGHYKGGSYYKGGRSYYPYNYGYNNSCYKNKQHHNNNNNNDNDDLWIGLLGGGIVGYAISNIYPVH
jgi:hypothetical protein